MSYRRLLAGSLAFVAMSLLATANTAYAQCNHLVPDPGYTPETYGANQIKLRYLATGPGSGDDKPLINKSTFYAPSLTFDPLTTHTLHLTVFRNTIPGPVLWTTSIPPSSTLWSQQNLANGVIRWKFTDPLTTYGVKKAQVNYYPGGLYIIVKVLGANTNVTNAPVTAGSDIAFLMGEIEAGGTGHCYAGYTAACSGTGNTQVCQVQ